MSEPYDVTSPDDRARGLRRLVDRTGREWIEPTGTGSTGPRHPEALTAVCMARHVARIHGSHDAWIVLDRLADALANGTADDLARVVVRAIPEPRP
jgi:hypothetical protein